MEDSISWKKYFESWKNYKKDVSSYGHNPEKIIEKMLPLFSSPKLVLDIGSGPGDYLKFFPEAVALDFSKSMMYENSSEKVLGLAEKLPFKDKSFDLAISIALMEYADAGKIISEMKRVSDLLFFTFEKIADKRGHIEFESGPEKARIRTIPEMKSFVGPGWEIKIMEFPGYGPYLWTGFLCRKIQ